MKMPSAGFPVKVGTPFHSSHLFYFLISLYEDIPVFPTVSGTATFTIFDERDVEWTLFDIPEYPLKKPKPPSSPSPSSSSASSPPASPSKKEEEIASEGDAEDSSAYEEGIDDETYAVNNLEHET